MKKLIFLLVGALIVLLPGCATQQPLWEANKVTYSLSDAERAYAAEDYEKAARLFLPLAEHGDVLAQFKLGMLHEKGLGVRQDYKEAVRWYRLAAAQGDTDAQLTLGGIYALGLGIRQDYKEAVKWYRLAAEQGDVLAQLCLGTIYARGRGVASLGGIYPNEQGVPKNHKEAAKWYRLAAEQGDVYAQTSLGLMYERGEGVPQDYVMSLMWLNIATANTEGEKQEKLISSRNLMEKLMTAQQIAEAQRLATKCISSKLKEC